MREDEDTQFEFVMILIRLSYHTNSHTRKEIIDELSKYDRQFEANQRLLEVLSKIDL